MVGTVACGLFTLTSVDTDASQASSLGTCLLFQEALSKLPWPRRLPVPFLPPRCSSKVSFRPRAPFWAGAPRGGGPSALPASVSLSPQTLGLAFEEGFIHPLSKYVLIWATF